MLATVRDEDLRIHPTDPIPVRAAKVSLKAGRRLGRPDDLRMVSIVVEHYSQMRRRSRLPRGPANGERYR